jgi:hypothetical protein
MTIDYTASAELFLPKGKPGARRSPGYRRFATAAEAICFVVEEFPAVRTLGAWMKVGEERFNVSNAYTRVPVTRGAVACGNRGEICNRSRLI